MCDPEPQEGNDEKEDMTEEDKLSKSPKKGARVQKKTKPTKVSDTHYFAKIPPRVKSGKSTIVELTDKIKSLTRKQSN